MATSPRCAATLVTRDGCFADPAFGVHAWAPALHEDDLVGAWTGTVTTTMRTPADHMWNTPASEDTSVEQVTFEIVRKHGKLFLASAPATPIAIQGGPSGALVDHTDDLARVVTYTRDGSGLRVVTEIKGHFGGTSTGLFHRVKP